MLNRFSPLPILVLSLVVLLGDATMVWLSRPPASEQPVSLVQEAKSQVPPQYRERMPPPELTSSHEGSEPVIARETIQGRIVVAGEVPPPRVLKITKDIEYLGDQVLDPSLIVDEVSKGIANVVVWIDRLDGWPGSIAAEQDEKVAEEQTIFIRKGLFEPRVAVIQTGDRLTIENTDEIGHNPMFDWLSHIGRTVAPGTPQVLEPTQGKPLPVQISCSIHSHMSSWLVVAAHPYVAVTDDQGRFTIPDVPVAEHQLVFWHERLGTIDREWLIETEDDPDTLAIDIAHFE